MNKDHLPLAFSRSDSREATKVNHEDEQEALTATTASIENHHVVRWKEILEDENLSDDEEGGNGTQKLSNSFHTSDTVVSAASDLQVRYALRTFLFNAFMAIGMLTMMGIMLRPPTAHEHQMIASSDYLRGSSRDGETLPPDYYSAINPNANGEDEEYDGEEPTLLVPKTVEDRKKPTTFVDTIHNNRRKRESSSSSSSSSKDNQKRHSMAKHNKGP